MAQLWSLLAVFRRAVLANKQLGKFVTPAKEKTPTMCKTPNRDLLSCFVSLRVRKSSQIFRCAQNWPSHLMAQCVRPHILAICYFGGLWSSNTSHHQLLQTKPKLELKVFLNYNGSCISWTTTSTGRVFMGVSSFLEFGCGRL